MARQDLNSGARIRESLTGGAAGRPWSLLLRLGPFRWDAAAPTRAARVGIGVLLPLIVGWATGRLDLGAFAALGALSGGLTSFRGATRSRLAAVAAATAGMGVSTFVGGTLAATVPWLLVAVMVAWGYMTGIAVSLGQAASVAVLQWSVALIIASGLPLSPGQAVIRAGLVLAGGLLQVGLLAGSWFVRVGERERTALAEFYRGVTAYAREIAGGDFRPPPPMQFPAAAVLHDPNPLLPGEIHLLLLDMLELAERLRASLAALATQPGTSGEDHGEEVQTFARRVSTVLELLAATLTARSSRRPSLADVVDEQVAALEISAAAPWQWTAEAMLGQLRAAASDASRLAEVRAKTALIAGGHVGVEVAPDSPGQRLAVVRANANLGSEAGRHALRLAVVAGLAELLVQATGVEEGRWVVLTVFLVLKPDYSTTLPRGVQRALGTVLGAALGLAAVQLGDIGPGGLVLAAGAAAVLAYAAFDVNYLLFSLFLTTYVVVLLELLGSPALPTAEARLLDTAIGAGLALLAYIAWPTWEGLGAQTKFARLIEAHRDYAVGLLRALAGSSDADPSQLRGLQVAARRARSDAEASTARLSAEPPHPPLTPAAARAVMAPVGRLAHAELVLHALASSLVPGEAQHGERESPEKRLETLAAGIGAAMTAIATALHALNRPAPIPALRPMEAALREPPPVDADVRTAVDDLVDAVDTIDATLRERVLDGAQPAVHEVDRRRGAMMT